ncbi:MAG TPA: AAA family ATPase [Candidatus Saccharibacteria bacterium]|nr:AAA family ATPase [Candidatus Saccharibacteria bacterium]
MRSQTPSTAHVVILVGIPGAGKSFFAEYFAKAFNAPLVNVHTIAQTLDIDETAAFKVGDMLLGELFKTGRTIVYEGPTSTKQQRKDIAKRVASAGYQPLFVWVQTESSTAKSRVARKTHAGKRLTGSEFEEQVRAFQAPTEKEKCLVISGKHTFSSQLRVVLKHLVGPRAQVQQNRPASDRQAPLR